MRFLGSSGALAAVGLALLAFLVTLVAFFARPRSRDRSVVRDDALLAELRELRRVRERTVEVLGRLEAVLAEQLAAPDSRIDAGIDARVPLGELPTTASFEALARSLDALRASFERESGATRELIREAPAFGGESLVAVRERRRETDWGALEGLEERWRRDPRAADRAQYFQTAHDLLEAYGSPTAIYRPEGGLLFFYRRLPEDVPGPSWYFRLQDGIVIEFYVEDEGS